MLCFSFHSSTLLETILPAVAHVSYDSYPLISTLLCQLLYYGTFQVMEVEVVGGSPFGAGPWAYGGRAAAASTARVRVLIGDPWTQGARVQLEFPYQPKCVLNLCWVVTTLPCAVTDHHALYGHD